MTGFESKPQACGGEPSEEDAEENAFVCVAVSILADLPAKADRKNPNKEDENECTHIRKGKEELKR